MIVKMGKSKTRRVKKNLNNPIGIPSVKELECEELLPLKLETDSVDLVLERLLSKDADEKECAAFTIANMANNPTFITSLIENKAIRVAAPLLLDRNCAVRHAIAGSLRNVAACGDHSVCQAMVDQDILTSLVALILEYKSAWAPVKNIENKIDSKSEIFLEACNLLWSLCESSDIAVNIFNKSKLLSVLLPCLDIETYGLQIPLAVAQCLHTVVEENPEVVEELSQPSIQEKLKSFMTLTPGEPEHVLLKTLSAGIMLNISSGNTNNGIRDIAAPVIEVVASTLNESIISALTALSEQITSQKILCANEHEDDNAAEEKVEALEKSFKAVNYLLQAKQISLELLANICFDDDSRSEWDDVSSSDTNEEMEVDVDETSVAPMKLGLRVPCEIHGIIVNAKLLEKVVEQIVVPPEDMLSVISGCSDGKDCLKRLNTVKCRALLCLSNMVQGLDIDDMGGPSKLFDLWMNVANLLFKQNDSTDAELLEAATSSLRAVLQRLVEVDCSAQFSNLTESDLQFLINMCQQSQDSATKVNVIRSLGTIGCLLGNPALFQASHKLIVMIGAFLLEVCSKNFDLWVTAEALDVIFDVFAEDHVDPIAQEISLVEKLTHLIPFLKGKMKQQRKNMGEHYPVIMTAKSNLVRFIKYKNDQNKK